MGHGLMRETFKNASMVASSIGLCGSVLLRVISQIEKGRWAMADSLLVLVPHKTLHGTISI